MNAPQDGLGRGYRWRRLSPQQNAAVADALAAGADAGALAVAYGVHRRTIYRARSYAAYRKVVAQVGDWWAEFELRDDGPVRCSSWYAA